MEIIRKEDKKLIMSQHVGEATVTLKSGEKVTYDLSATVNGSPIVTFQNGDYVIFSWEDIINLADKVNQMKQEPSEKEVFNTNEDVLYQIAMIIFWRHNDKIASINDHLGESYSYSDLQDAETYRLEDENSLMSQAVMQLQQEKKDLIKYIEDEIEELSEEIREVELDGFSSEHRKIQKDIYEDILERVKSGKYE